MGIKVTDESLLPCGKKYKNVMLRDIPGSYLLWLADQRWFQKQYPYILAYIAENRKVLELEAAQERDNWLEEHGYRDDDL